jgi:hypothetical protein
VQGTGPGEVERPGLAVPQVQGNLAGVAGTNPSPGGEIANGLPIVPEKVSGSPQEVPAVRSPDVTARLLALQQEKEQLLQDPRNRGIAGGEAYTPETIRRLNELNAEIQYHQVAAVTPGGSPTPVDAQAHTAATSPTNDLPEPTPAQIEAGNYKKGHVKVHGLDIAIENPAGSLRKGIGEDGKPWETKLAHHYGYVKGTVGKDKDHVDVFVGPNNESNNVFVIDQKDTKTGRLDEHKVMLGFDTLEEARAGYLANYDATGPQRIMDINGTTVDGFRQWLKDGDPRKPFPKNATPQPAAKNPLRRINQEKDSILVAIAKLGGIDRAQVDAAMGNARDLASTLNGMATKGQGQLFHVISKTGRPLDTIRELLVENGYLPEGATINDLLDKLDSASRGTVHRSTFSTEYGADAIQSAEDRYIEMVAAMTDEEYEEFSRNHWQDEQVELLAEAGAIIDEYLAGMEQEEMTAADWQAVENDFKEAVDAEFSADSRTEDQGLVPETPPGETEGVPAVSQGDVASQDPAETEAVVETPEPTPEPVAPAPLPAVEKKPRAAKTPAVVSPAAAPEPEAVKPPVTPAKIEDFGEKIGGARKDTAERGIGKTKITKPDDSVPAWRKRFKVAESVRSPGTFSIIDTKEGRYSFSSRSQTFDSEEAAEQAIPVYAVAKTHQITQNAAGAWDIYKRIGERKRLKVVNQDFASREEAMQHMVLNAEKLLETKTTFGEEILPVPEIAIRRGVPRRTEPATPQMFMETFAPRGIEFGNWNNQEERQQVMDHAYDGLLDLAEVLNVPPKALMLDGDLAIAFGARGQGLSGAKAHYEPDFGVINLTKMKGAGSLAHEWFHALDHYLGRQDTKASSEKETDKKGNLVYKSKGATDFLSNGISYKSKVRPEIQEAYKLLIGGMFRKAQQYVEDTQKADKFVGTARENLQSSLDGIRKNLATDLAEQYTWRKVKRGLRPASAEQLMEFDRLATVLVEGGDLKTDWRANNPDAPARSRGGMSGRRTNETLEGISRILKEVRGSTGFNTEGKGTLDRLRADMGLYEARLTMLKDAEGQTEKTKQIPTSFAMEAKKMDQARTSDYWSEPHEMAARAFAAYVEDKVAEQGGQSDFIVYHAHGGILVPMIDGFIARPYPEGEERTAINAAFDGFVSQLETRETDKGTALFALAPGDEKGIIEQGGHDNVIRQASHKRSLSQSAVARIRKSVQSLQDYLGTGSAAVQGSPRERRRQQDQLAREWAESNNLPIIPEEQFLDRWNESGQIRGGENRVYIEQDADGTLWAFKMNDLGYHRGDMAALADRIVKSSEYFPNTTIEIIGMVETPQGLKPLLKQPFIVKATDALAPRAAIRRVLQEMGFQLLDPDADLWLSPDQNYYVSDMGRTNVILDEFGDLAFIDGLFQQTSAAEIARDFPRLVLPPPPAQFSLEKPQRVGVKAGDAQTWISTLPISGHVTVVQSVEELPANARAEITKAKVDPTRVQAMELKGTIYVIADNIPDMARVKALVIGHELAHAGQSDKIVDLAVDWFKRTTDGKTEQARAAHAMLQTVATRYGFDLSDEKQFRLAVQEATAAYAEQAVSADWKPAGLMQRLFMYVKHWLRQNGLISHVSDSELALAVAEMLRIGEKRLSVGKGGSAAMFAAAWHGSPHDFEQFNTDAIGTGEGAQVYGYGLYFAGNKEVAEFYRNNLSSWNPSREEMEEYFKPGNIVPSYGGWDKVISFDKGQEPWQWSVTVKAVDNRTGEFLRGERNRTHFTTPAPADFKRITGKEPRRGRLYSVELAPSEDEYLLWDKALSEQSEKVKAALIQAYKDKQHEAVAYNKEHSQTGDKYDAKYHDLMEQVARLSQAYDAINGERNNSGADTYHALQSMFKSSHKAASEYLHSLGIRGIKYLDGSSRGTKPMPVVETPGAWWVQDRMGKMHKFDTKAEADTFADTSNYNYVIFNDADVSITSKFALEDQAIAEHAARIDAPTKVADMTKGLFNLIGQSVPERLKANIGKLMSNPWFGSEGKPIRRHVVDLNLERGQNRNSIISDLFQASEGYTGVEGLDNILKKASKEELKQFNELIKYGDENGVAQTFTRDELYRGKTKFGKLSKTVVEAYKAFIEVMQAANRVRFQQLDELSMLPYKDQVWFDALLDLLNKNQQRTSGLNQQEAADFHRLVRSLKRDLTDRQLETGENPAQIKASPAVIAAYHAFWQQVDQTEKKQQGGLLSAFRDILGYRGELDKLKNEWGNLRGYAPRNRKDGDWHVSVYTTNEAGERTKVYMKPTLTETGAKGLVKEVKADLAKHLKGNFKAGTEYEVEYERNQATPSELLAWKGSEVAVEALLNQAFDRAGVTGKMSVEQWQSLKDEVFQQIAKEIMAQGFGRHGISREATLIEGYDDTDYQTVLKEYISGMSGWLSKMRFAIETTAAAKDISKADPADKVWVNDYVQDAMKNSTYMDELAATARSVGAVYYLGFKVSSAMLNAFQNYTVGQAELSMMMRKAGKKGSAVLMLASAQKDVMRDWTNRKRGGKGTLTQEETDVLHKAVREGTAQAQATRMISGSQEMGFGTGWKKFTELSMTPFQFVEQMVNREPAVLAAYRAFKKTAAGEFDAAAYKQAEVFVNNTHYVMGKENLPEMVRKLGPLGKTVYLFQGYVHNYLHWMFNRARDGEFATIARSLGAVAALGGVFALPGADDLDKWIMKWYGVSYKMKFRKFVRENAGKTPAGQMITDFINHGVTSVAGVDMSRALSVSIPFISDPEKTFGERMGGAWGGLLKKPGMALSAAQKGDYVRAVENLMPEFAANPMRAARQFNQGATTLGGKPIFDETGHQVKYSASDVGKKMLGFNPLEISDRTTLKGNERDLNAYWKSERDDVMANIRRAKTQAELNAARKGVIKYNQDLRKSQAFGLVPIITSVSIEKSRTFKPLKKTMMWERNQLDS